MSTVRSGSSPPVAHSISWASSDAVEAAPVPLVGQGRGREPVGHHPGPGIEGRRRPPRRRAGPGRPPSAAPRPARRPGADRGRAAAGAGPIPNRVAPGSKVRTAPSRSASSRAWVDLPQPSIPSSAIRRPRRPSPSPRTTGPRRRSAVGLGAGAFLAAAAFLAARLLGRRLLGARSSWPSPSWPRLFLAGAFFLAAFFRVGGPGGPALGQQLGGPLDGQASTSSPLRSEALVVPSVT